MRLTAMSFTPRLFAAALFVSFATMVHAQDSVGGNAQNPATPFTDTSSLKPPAGAKVAIVEYEDLECPACARAFPIVHEAAKHYQIPILRYDFPLKMHVWSHDAAIIARYIQDKISPSGADEYRREVFASQQRIASKDDLQQFTAKFFADNHKQLPMLIDPTGQFAKEVDAEEAQGERANLKHTPTIVVVTAHHWIEVLDVMQLYAAIDQAKAIAEHETPAPAAKHIVSKSSK